MYHRAYRKAKVLALAAVMLAGCFAGTGAYAEEAEDILLVTLDEAQENALTIQLNEMEEAAQRDRQAREAADDEDEEAKSSDVW